MQHPHVIYWMGKTVKNDYRAYGYFCFVSGIILAAMAGYVLLPSLYSYLSAQIASLAASLSAAGKKVTSLVLGALKAAIGELSEIHPLKKAEIAGILILLAQWIIEKTKEIDELSDAKMSVIRDDENNIIGTKVVLVEGGGFEEGKVILFNNPNDIVEYEYRKYEGGYQVWINGEWVQMPEGWLPGNEISPAE
jgi:hypothetical protein